MLLCFIVVVVLLAFLRYKRSVAIFLFSICRRPGSIGFFHPFCEDGGGGEVVLWTAVDELCRRRASVPLSDASGPFSKIFIYTGWLTEDGKAALRSKIDRRFSFGFDWDLVEFVPLRYVFHFQLFSCSGAAPC